MAKEVKIASLLGPGDKAREMRYQAEDDLRTMQRYQELCASPARMKAVHRLIKEQAELVEKTTAEK
jgi:hypothetical protein